MTEQELAHLAGGRQDAVHGTSREAAKRVLTDSLDDAKLREHMSAIDSLRSVWPARVLDAKRRIAQRVLENDGYPL